MARFLLRSPGAGEAVNKLLDWAEIGSEGGFSTLEVARLLGRKSSEIAEWMRGSPALIQADYHPLHGRPLLTFEALVEARAIGHFLDEGVKKARLREIMVGLRRTTGSRHPLASDLKVVSDGFRLLEMTDDGKLVNLANDVYADRTLMKPALIGRVVFDKGRARFFQPDPTSAPLVRVDPKLSFGKPVVVDGGRAVPTHAVAATAEDEGVVQAARWFGISKAAATQALEFERRLAA